MRIVILVIEDETEVRDAIARDLAMDYAETWVAGERLIYRSA